MTAALGLLAMLLTAQAGAGDPAWLLLSREDGCVDAQLLARRERLPRGLKTPEEFAAAMRAKGHAVTLELPPGFPPELAGRVVMMRVRDDLAPVFVREDVCRSMEQP